MLSSKYRPKRFSELEGQAENVIILKELLKKGIENTPPLLFTGGYGSGKTSASRVYAKAILCEKLTEDFEPCGSCQSCIDFDADKNISYVEIDAATNGDVESIRKLREQTQYQSLGTSKYKITNIDEAHNITKAGYNALLKILEQGSSHHIFIFCTNEPEKMIDTVRSRCWRFESVPVNKDILRTHLEKIAALEGIAVEKDALELIAKVSVPHIRDAINTLDFLNYKGKVVLSDVENYYQLSHHNLFLNVLLYVKDDIVKSFSYLKCILDVYDINTAFEKLCDTCLTLECAKRGVEVDIKYYDDSLFNNLLNSGLDFLGISSYLLKLERPLDATYLKYMLLELNRIQNNVDVANYSNPHITVVVNTDKKPDAEAIIKAETTKAPAKKKVPLYGIAPTDIMSLPNDDQPKKLPETALMKNVDVQMLNWNAGKKTSGISVTDYSSFMRPRKPVSTFEQVDTAKHEKKKNN